VHWCGDVGDALFGSGRSWPWQNKKAALSNPLTSGIPQPWVSVLSSGKHTKNYGKSPCLMDKYG